MTAQAVNSLPLSFLALPSVREVLRRYGDIVYQPRPVHDNDVFSRTHPKMAQVNRAKLFAPFAALDGYSDTQYVDKAILDADEEWELNRRLCKLHSLTRNRKMAESNRVIVTVEYFIPCDDPENDAYGNKGQYKKVAGSVRRVDQYQQSLKVCGADGSTVTIPFSNIYYIDSPIKGLWR